MAFVLDSRYHVRFGWIGHVHCKSADGRIVYHVHCIDFASYVIDNDGYRPSMV